MKQINISRLLNNIIQGLNTWQPINDIALRGKCGIGWLYAPIEYPIGIN